MLTLLSGALALAAASVAASVAAAPPLADDIPTGTDIALRVDVSRLREASVDAWLDLKPILAFRSDLARAGRRLERRWYKLIDEIERFSGADFTRSNVTATVAIDLDASGGQVLSAVIRGAFAKPPGVPTEAKINDAMLEMGDGPALEHFTIDGVAAYRRGDTAWATIPGARKSTTLVVGNRRGLQRQVRLLVNRKSKKTGDNALALIARRLRKPAPLLVAFNVSSKTAVSFAKGLSDFAFLAEATHAGVLTAHPDRFELQLDSADGEDRDTVIHGMRAGIALVRSAVALLEGSTELLLGLDTVGKQSKLLPRRLDGQALSPLLDQWVRGFEITGKVHKRATHTTEVAVELSSYNGLLTVALLLLGNSSLTAPSVESEASVLLLMLRRAQLLHKEINGSFVACGPVPKKIPKSATRWPTSTCFDRLAFAPPKPMRVQLEASVDDGKLLLVARADPDGDGVPMVWYLDEESEKVRGMGADEPVD